MPLNVMLIADIHGSWDTMYAMANAHGADAVIILGDAETVRDVNDLQFLPAPQKFKRRYTVEGRYEFAPYWLKGAVPVPTWLVPGNHEAFGLLSEFETGTLPAPIIENLHYCGHWALFELAGLRFASFGRVYHPEHSHLDVRDPATGAATPYRWRPKKSWNGSPGTDSPKMAAVHHELDMLALADAIAEQGGVDVIVTHEPPYDDEWIGYRNEFRRFGSILVDQLVELSEPKLVISGHMHVPRIARHKTGAKVVYLPLNEPVMLKDVLQDDFSFEEE